jgi:hypothetical protein
MAGVQELAPEEEVAEDQVGSKRICPALLYILPFTIHSFVVLGKIPLASTTFFKWRYKMSNIQYKPNFDYEKNYNTAGNLNTTEQQTSQSNTDIYNEAVDNLSDKLKAIEDAIRVLPTEIYNAVKSPITGVRYMLDNLGAGDAQPIPTTMVKQTTDDDSPIIIPTDTGSGSSGDDTDENGLEDIPDEIFPEGDGTSVNIEIITVPDEDVIDQEYKYDMACIFVDYINKMNDSIAKFYSNIVAISTEVDIPSFLDLYAKFDGSSKNISDNMKPMSDFVIRNQISLDQQLRMYTKLFDVDSMILNIRACKSAAELRKRYFKAQYVPDSDLLSMNQNDLLANTRIDFDKKYTENLYNLYKYLNSSVILIDESMKLELKMSQAKATLIKNEGVSLQW